MIRTTQIIVAALTMGVTIFAGIALFQRINRPPDPNALLAYLGAGFAATALAVRSVIGGQTATRQRQRIATGKWSGMPRGASSNLLANTTNGDRLLFVFQQKTIIESALVEGAAFFVLVTFVVVGQWWSLAVAVGLLTVLVVP